MTALDILWPELSAIGRELRNVRGVREALQALHWDRDAGPVADCILDAV